jgi:hypothetical protein
MARQDNLDYVFLRDLHHHWCVTRIDSPDNLINYCRMSLLVNGSIEDSHLRRATRLREDLRARATKCSIVSV